MQVGGPVDGRKQWLSDQIAGFFGALQSIANALPLGPFNDILNGGLFLLRRAFLNQAPVVAPVQLTGLSDVPINGRVNAFDPEGDQIVYQLVQGPKTGAVQLNSDGSFTYTPGAGFDGVDSFVVMAQDLGLHVNLLDPFRGVGTSAGTLVNEGAITFAFNYTTGADLWTFDRRTALATSANELAKYFLVTTPVTLTYDVAGTNNPFSGQLAAAGSDLISEAPGFWNTVVQNKMITGVDSNGSAADGSITWNWGQPWSLGAIVSGGTYDFTSTAMHEVLHSFGFMTQVGQAGTNTGRAWGIYDSFISNSSGSRAIFGDYRWNTAFDPNLTRGNGGLFLGGPNAYAAYGNRYVPLYTPNPWEDGSSVHHLDDATFTGANEQLMNAISPTGQGIRVLSSIEVGILTDLGYTVVNPTPVSGAGAIAMIGFVFVRRVRRKASAPTS